MQNYGVDWFLAVETHILGTKLLSEFAALSKAKWRICSAAPQPTWGENGKSGSQGGGIVALRLSIAHLNCRSAPSSLEALMA